MTTAMTSPPIAPPASAVFTSGELPGWMTLKSSIARALDIQAPLPLHIQHRLHGFQSFIADHPADRVKTPQLRRWIQGVVIAVDDSDRTMKVEDDSGAIIVNWSRVPAWQLPRPPPPITETNTDTVIKADPFGPTAVDVGSYVLVQGVVKSRTSNGGVSMLAHSVKDLSEEHQLRSRLWTLELAEAEALNEERALELEERRRAGRA